MMTYLPVKWKRKDDDPRFPMLIYSELDDERWETRKVEVFPGGRLGYADASAEIGGTGLAEKPIPALADTPPHPELESVEIAKEEFETMWAKRNG